MKTSPTDSSPVPTEASHLDRRAFLSKASLFGAVAAFSPAALLMSTRSAAAIEPSPSLDIAILNFALNLEYLEAEYYLNATKGSGLKNMDTLGDGAHGKTIVKDNAKVPFATDALRQYAQETAQDEENHVLALRATIKSLGGRPAAKPVINLKSSFYALGSLIGVPNFDPYANEVNFLLGSYVFEDVGVTAYGGAAALIDNKAILTAAAKILAVEAYHAGSVRTILYGLGSQTQSLTNKISKVRASLGGPDQGVLRQDKANIIPTDSNSLVFVRDTRHVLNIVYGAKDVDRGLFFPAGMNGAITK